MNSHSAWVLQEQVVPRLRSTIPHSVNFVGCEDAQELIQDATAVAARMLSSVEAVGKKVTPGNIAYYALQHIKSGRRSTGSTVVDVLGSGTQLNGNTRLTSLDEPASTEEESGGETFTFNDLLSNDQEDPAMATARKLDWQAFIGTLDGIGRAILDCLSQERPLTEVATRFGVSRSSVQLHKNRLSQAVREYMGADLLRELQRAPQWRINLQVIRQRLACRAQH